MQKNRITLEEIKENIFVKTLIRVGNENLKVMGFTEHGFRHLSLVSNIAYNVIRILGLSEREAELASIAGYMHDIGNVVNRRGHHLSGAILAYYILDDLGMHPDELFTVVSAIGNHDEETGTDEESSCKAVISFRFSPIRCLLQTHRIAYFAALCFFK